MYECIFHSYFQTVYDVHSTDYKFGPFMPEKLYVLNDSSINSGLFWQRKRLAKLTAMMEWLKDIKENFLHPTHNQTFPSCSVYAQCLPTVQERKLGWKVLICEFISLSSNLATESYFQYRIMQNISSSEIPDDSQSLEIPFHHSKNTSVG